MSELPKWRQVSPHIYRDQEDVPHWFEGGVYTPVFDGKAALKICDELESEFRRVRDDLPVGPSVLTDCVAFTYPDSEGLDATIAPRIVAKRTHHPTPPPGEPTGDGGPGHG